MQKNPNSSYNWLMLKLFIYLVIEHINSAVIKDYKQLQQTSEPTIYLSTRYKTENNIHSSI